MSEDEGVEPHWIQQAYKLSGSRRVVLEGIAGGLDTPVKLCANARGVQAYSMAVLLRELWAFGYIRVVGRDQDIGEGYKNGGWKVELTQKGKEEVFGNAID